MDDDPIAPVAVLFRKLIPQINLVIIPKFNGFATRQCVRNVDYSRAELLIANLLVEYIGCGCFRQVVQQVEPIYVSCVIQVNSIYSEPVIA